MVLFSGTCAYAIPPRQIKYGRTTEKAFGFDLFVGENMVHAKSVQVYVMLNAVASLSLSNFDGDE